MNIFKPGVSNISGIVGNAANTPGRFPGMPRNTAQLGRQLGLSDVVDVPHAIAAGRAGNYQRFVPDSQIAQIAQSRRAGYGGGGQIGQIAAALARIEERLTYLESGKVVPQGGGVTSGSRMNNIAALASPPRVGKGGVLQLTPVTFAAGAIAGVTQTASLSDAIRAKLTDTVLELASVSATGDLNDSDELKKMRMSVYVNDDPIPTLFNVPCDLLTETLDGPQLAIVKRYIGSDANLTAVFTVETTLTTANAATITLRMWAGDGTTYTS